jgi:hypothetical protein
MLESRMTSKESRPVRRGADGKGRKHLASGLPYYIAGWAKDMVVFRRNLSEVQTISHQLIGIIEGEDVPAEEQQDPR